MSGRWTIFFENPNMTAAIVAEVGVLLLVLCGRTRGFLRAALALLAALAAAALAATGSRGGLVAFLVGAAVSAIAGLRAPKARRGFALAVAVVAVALAAATAESDLGERFVRWVRTGDDSVGNRLVIWRTVPRMMADAPDGWGVGNSGQAFTNWYQPLDRTERYRTLVGSHFTWLVEFGGGGRFLYLFGWMLVLALAFRRWRRTGDALPAALWMTLAVAAVPTSVLEEWAVWILPAGASLPLLMDLRRDGRLPVGTLVSLSLVAALPVEIVRLVKPGAVRCSGGGCIVEYRPDGKDAVRDWIVPDDAVVGNDFPRLLRRRGAAMGIASSLNFVPDDARQITVCGATECSVPGRFRSFEEFAYLAPRFRPLPGATEGRPRVRFLVGEFSPAATDAPPSVEIVPGVLDFMPEAVWRGE